MARIRTVKPEFFRHEGLYEAEIETGLPLRIAFVGLWTVADREGRFRWKPRELKLDCLPYDDIEFGKILDQLWKYGFIIKYNADGNDFGYIPSWNKHQLINLREAQSKIPEPTPETHMHARAETDTPHHIPCGINIPEPLRKTIIARDHGKCVRCENTSDLTVDHIFPRSIGGTHAPTNLRCLCRQCNSARPVQGQGLIDDLAKDDLTLADMQRICMHVQARGEGEGEGEGNGEDTARAVPSPRYVFESGIIRLSEKDFEQWKEAYSFLDLRAELLSLTDFAQKNPDKWFFAVQGALAKRNRGAKLAQERAGDGEFKLMSGMQGVI